MSLDDIIRTRQIAKRRQGGGGSGGARNQIRSGGRGDDNFGVRNSISKPKVSKRLVVDCTTARRRQAFSGT